MYQEKPSAPGLTALPPTRCGYLPAEQRGIVVNLKGDLKAEYGPVSPQSFLRGDGFEECVLDSVSRTVQTQKKRVKLRIFLLTARPEFSKIFVGINRLR